MNLKLFKKDQVKNIIFILRDYDPDEDIQFIRNSVNDDLIKIWKEIKKPEEFENSIPSDLFKIDYYTLSSYKLQKDKFLSEVLIF